VTINIERLKRLVLEMHESLPGILATDIWIADAGDSLAAYNGQPAALEVTNTLTNTLIEATAAAGFPGINRYFLLDLAGDTTAMVILHGDNLRQGVLLDTRFTNIGTMLALGLPMAVRGVAEARAEG
jgi:hypothetical protein